MKHTLAALIVMLPLLFSAQTAPGCVVAGADVAASLASATTCLDIPAGVYTVGAATAGAWLNAPQDSLEIKGAGEDQTILRVTSSLTLTADIVVLRLFGVGQHIHDLTIDLGSGHHGAGSLAGISVYGSGVQGANSGRAERTVIERVEVLGGYTPDGAKGYGIGTYRGYLDNGSAQYVTIRDCSIHDSPSTAIGVNSSSNIIAHNHIARVGASFYAHGIYLQGGGNTIDGNVIEQASGWAIHGHKQVPSLDGSGDRIVNNLIVNPGAGGVVINSAVNGSNPSLPSGVPLTRYATIANNTLRNTGGKRNLNPIWCNTVPCVIEGNTLEDTFVTNGSGWIEDSGGSVITGNLLTTTGTAPDGPVNMAGIRVSAGTGAIVTNNAITIGVGCCAGIEVMGNDVQVQNNRVSVAGSNVGLKLRGDGGIYQGNRIASTGSVALAFTLTGPTNIFLTGNYFKRSAALGALFSLNMAGITGRISGNMYDGSYTFSNAAPGVVQ